jgi:prepilin-type N-terminal cleavage/methylation domain-containing protein
MQHHSHNRGFTARSEEVPARLRTGTPSADGEKLRRGFTFIEMLVVIAITGVVSVALGSMLGYFYRSNDYVLESTTATNSAREGTTVALQNLRESTYGDDGSYPITTAGTSTLVFFSNVDSDNAVEQIKLYVLNNTLYEVTTNSAGSPPSYAGQPSATTTLGTFVRNTTASPLFQYYDATGTLLTGTVNISQIRSIKMSLLIDLNPNRAPDIYTLTGTATLRNLSSNS